jgi:hypothetical protein
MTKHLTGTREERHCRREIVSEIDIGGPRDATRPESGNAAALGAADWLCLAAAPAFAIMALLTAALAAGRWRRCAERRKMRHR